MQKIVLIPMFLLASVSMSASAADECQPLHKSSQVTVTVAAKKDKNTIESFDKEVKYNALSPVKPEVKLLYVAGDLSFSLTPIAACKDGLKLEIDGYGHKSALAPWGKAVVIDGKEGSDYFVKVTATKK